MSKGFHQTGRVLTFLFLLLAANGHAEVVEKLQYAYYDVAADPARPLLAALDAASPIRENGRILHAHTSWSVKWNFRRMERTGKCRITRIRTEVAATITLPRLSGASAEQRAAFGKYLSALRAHELGHYENGKNAAAEIERKILALPEMPTCKELDDAANAIGDRTVDIYTGKDRYYDLETEYGKSQGVWLEE